MLDSETKRRIDSARDVLVGKVPDPKAQVEQITTALIYKFMDDMDRDSEKLGGKASFIVEELEPYKWANLMSTALGGNQRLETYISALKKFSESSHIPDIFRKIFKDAFLPYRDPETLNLFLKEIAYFDYDHSENLGNAFEYLLNIMGSQGDAGQFRTPRHVIDFIVDIIKPKKGERILDPACGTAGFLISAYKYIREHEKNLDFKERKELMENITGYDISPDMVRLSLVNMYLHQFPQPKVFEHDTLTSEDYWRESFDVILANPPFMTPKGGIRPHKRFRVQAKRSEVLFVDYIFEHLAVNGRAGIIVPEGIIFQSATAYKALRKILVEEKFLWAVVSLPAGVFQPYSGVKTSILLLDKSIAKQKDTILFIKINQDGFDLGAQRREIKQNDLPRALELLEQYQRGETFDDPLALVVSKSKIAQSGDYNLTGDRYKETVKHNTVYPMVKLGEVCEVLRGTSYSSENLCEESGIKLWNLKSVNRLNDIFEHNFKYFRGDYKVKYITKEEDILIALTDLTKTSDLIGLPILVDEIGLYSADLGKLIFRDEFLEKLNPKYIFFILRNEKYHESIKTYSHGTNVKHLQISGFYGFEVPLPPLEVQNTIVEEIEQYQKVIDGAKQVISNYRPTISIDPTWEMVKLGDDQFIQIIDGDRGVNYPSKDEFKTEGYCLFLNTSNVRKGYFDFTKCDFITKEKDELLRKGKLFQEDIVLTTRGTLGNTAHYSKNIEFKNMRINSGMVLLRCNLTKISPKFLLLFLNTVAFESQVLSFMSGSAQPQLPIRVLSEIEIPLPSLEEQNAIVEEIEKERAAVEACKQLVEQFETKIKTKIAKIWGE